MEKEYILECNDITMSFPGVLALDSVDFKLEKGEIHAIVGENGAGKSTFVKILLGLYKYEGDIYIDGKPVEIKNPSIAAKLGINMVYQELSLSSKLSAIENIFLGREYSRKIPGIVDLKKEMFLAKKVLDELGVKINIKIPIDNLSFYERQIIEIAKALIRECKILILDEPTSALAPYEIESLLKVMRQSKEKGMSMIFITHHMEEIFQVADRVTVLRDGNKIFTKNIKESNIEDVIKGMIGSDVTYRKHLYSGKKLDDALEVKNLSSKGNFDDINFKVRKKEVLGITGLLGAGKTELAETIFGLRKFDKGKVIVFGNETKISSPIEAIKNGIGLISEDRKEIGLLLEMLISENMTIANLDIITKLGFINLTKEKICVNNMVDDLEIDASVGIFKKVKFLSGGNQQKVVIARWLLKESKILILDEPTRGIDVAGKEKIYDLINNLVETTDIAVIICSSEIEEILRICNRIIILKRGKLSGELTSEDASKEKILEHATRNLEDK